MTASLSRQIATGAAAFVLTALLIVANAPGGTEQGLRSNTSAGARILTVLTRHG